MYGKILVTGGAGFIGSHITDELIKRGYQVRVMDNLDPQVHGKKRKAPEYLNRKAEFILGDIRDTKALKKALSGIDAVFHKVAKVGVGQSMYRIADYVDNNVLGTANLLQLIIDSKRRIKKLIVASSMSIYGEGAYKCPKCGPVYPGLRDSVQLLKRDWEVKCPKCQKNVSALPTNEEKPLIPTSIYAINKRDQEEMCLRTGIAYEIPTVALRYFNVYGRRQALSNPYTGVAAIFSGCILNKRRPVIFEDGRQSRDFIHVSDIVQANMLALEKKQGDYQVFNVGAGSQISILEVGRVLIDRLKADLKPQVANKFRVGDIRHCYADIGKITKTLGFRPKISFKDGISELIDWVKRQFAEDKMIKAVDELNARGLIK